MCLHQDLNPYKYERKGLIAHGLEPLPGTRLFKKQRNNIVNFNQVIFLWGIAGVYNRLYVFGKQKPPCEIVEAQENMQNLAQVTNKPTRKCGI